METEDRPSWARLTWDQTWMSMAEAIAGRSWCSRGGVGAVIVDPRNRIVAVGYTAPPANYPEMGPCRTFCERAIHGPQADTLLSYSDCVSIHAEANALLVCDRADRLGGTIYTTSDVCWNCAKLIANSGLKRVVARDTQHEHRNPQHSYDLLCRCDIAVNLIGSKA